MAMDSFTIRVGDLPEPDPFDQWCWSLLPEDAAGHTWTPSGRDGYLCLDCLSNDVIHRSGRIADANRGVCVFCNRESSGGARSVHDVIEFIYCSLRTEYDDESETDIHVPYDVRELFNAGAMSTSELLGELGEDLGEDLLAQLEESINHWWVAPDGLHPAPWERMTYSWRHFADTVRNGPRLLRRDNVSDSHDAHTLEDILHHLDVTASHLQTKLVHRVEPGEVILYRARNEPGLTGADDLGSPPPRFCGPQRMSAAGVSCFYAAEDEPTALAEIGSPPERTSVGKWETTKPMVVFDINQRIEVPSIFDYIGRPQRSYARFLNSFRNALIEPGNHDLGEANSYLPTQIFAEHLRYYLNTSQGQGVDAVRYPSEKTPDGTNWCIFGQPDHSEGGLKLLEPISQRRP